MLARLVSASPSIALQYSRELLLNFDRVALAPFLISSALFDAAYAKKMDLTSVPATPAPFTTPANPMENPQMQKLPSGVIIEDRAIIGGQVGFGDKARVEAGAIIGSGAGILTSKVVRAGEPVWGTPARPLRQYLRQLAALSRLARK